MYIFHCWVGLSPHRKRKNYMCISGKKPSFILSNYSFKGRESIVGTPPPTTTPLPLIKGLERGDKPEKVQSHLLCVCAETKIPSIIFRIFSLLSQPCKILIQVFIVLKPGIICTFLIHSGSVQKMLTAFFNFVWNTQKSKWTIFLSAQARCFFVLKRF